MVFLILGEAIRGCWSQMLGCRIGSLQRPCLEMAPLAVAISSRCWMQLMLSSNLRGWVVLSACRYCEMAWGYGVFNLELHSAAISCWKGTTGRLRAVCELDVSRVSANPCQDSPTNDNSSICLASSIGLGPFAGRDWPVNTLLVILIGLLPF